MFVTVRRGNRCHTEIFVIRHSVQTFIASMHSLPWKGGCHEELLPRNHELHTELMPLLEFMMSKKCLYIRVF